MTPQPCNGYRTEKLGGRHGGKNLCAVAGVSGRGQCRQCERYRSARTGHGKQPIASSPSKAII